MGHGQYGPNRQGIQTLVFVDKDVSKPRSTVGALSQGPSKQELPSHPMPYQYGENRSAKTEDQTHEQE
jgi:hypothetical protein